MARIAQRRTATKAARQPLGGVQAEVDDMAVGGEVLPIDCFFVKKRRECPKEKALPYNITGPPVLTFTGCLTSRVTSQQGSN